MIYICADDYGISPETCQRIEYCVCHGALNKISVLPNGAIADCKKPFSKPVYWSLHLNLVEGKALSQPSEVNLLTDEKGYFCHSFGGLLKQSLSSCKKEFANQLYREMFRQITRWKETLPEGTPIFLDSHQHVHMIPLVFRTLLQVIADTGLTVGYLRIPAEPLLPYLMTPSLYVTYRPVNLVKQWLLKLLWQKNRIAFRETKIPTAYFMGILFSGKMDRKRVEKVLPHYVRLAKKHDADIEVLFHPGYMEPGEAVPDENKTAFRNFYRSEGRKIEFDTVTQADFSNL